MCSPIFTMIKICWFVYFHNNYRWGYIEFPKHSLFFKGLTGLFISLSIGYYTLPKLNKKEQHLLLCYPFVNSYSNKLQK